MYLRICIFVSGWSLGGSAGCKWVRLEKIEVRRRSPKTAAAFLLHSNEGGRQVCGRVASSVGNLLDCIFLYLCVCVFVYLCICVFVYLCVATLCNVLAIRQDLLHISSSTI